MVAVDFNAFSLGPVSVQPQLSSKSKDGTEVQPVILEVANKDLPYSRQSPDSDPLPQPPARFGYDEGMVVELLDKTGEVITTFSMDDHTSLDLSRGLGVDQVI